MSEISVFGLGLMGSALARALLIADRDITVWNRSPKGLEPIIELGATGASSAIAAVTANPGYTNARRSY